VLLLARNEPLPEEDMQRLWQVLDRAPPPGKFDPLRGAVWLGPEDRFGHAPDRGRPNLDQTGTVVNPVERMRRLVRGDLKKMADEVRGVCYPFRGSSPRPSASEGGPRRRRRNCGQLRAERRWAIRESRSRCDQAPECKSREDAWRWI